MKIVVDAMGGDFAPENVIQGVIDSLKENDATIVLVGPEDIVKKELSKYQYPMNRIEIVHADEVVGMHESGTVTLRQKKNSSIAVGIKLLKDPEYDAFISAGNTGAVVAASTVFLRMLPGVERPAIGTVIPTLKNPAFLIDAGANTDAKPQHLLHSGMLARVYVREVLGVQNPTVGMVNIGEEESKGTGFAKETYKLLEEKLPNFIGNIEANEIYTGKCDCIVCDGFVGNIVLKVTEGLLESTAKLVKREVKKDFLAIIGALLMKPALRKIKKLADYSEYGGAPLLGVNGLVMIGHGRSSPKAIKNAIRATIREIEHDLIDEMIKTVSEL